VRELAQVESPTVYRDYFRFFFFLFPSRLSCIRTTSTTETGKTPRAVTIQDHDMSKRTSAAAANGAASKEGSQVNPSCMWALKET
jgi:hypothetical protein